jgi:surface antigen
VRVELSGAAARRRAVLTVLAAVAGLASPWAVASWGLAMRDSPARDFDDEDLRQFLAAIRQVLEAPLPPQPLEWSNPATGAGGTLLVIGQPRRQGFVECRRVRATLYSRRRQGQPQVWTACRQESGGNWNLVSAD